jgi:hypothetical protein
MGDVYLRLGDLPEAGRSRNFADGSLESGVSCFRGRETESGGYRAKISNLDQAVHFAAFRNDGRPAYVVQGTEVSVGDVEEPLLTGCSARKLPASKYPTMSPFWEAAARLCLRGPDSITEYEIRRFVPPRESLTAQMFYPRPHRPQPT